MQIRLRSTAHFLKKLKKTAQNNLILKPAELIINDQDHEVFNEDINEVASES